MIGQIFACPGSASVALPSADCVTCGGLTGMIESIDAQYAEDGTFVANGPGAIQAAVTAAARATSS